MARHVCLYFQVHQPYRLRDLRITEIGREDMEYFDREKNRAVFRKVAEKCYLPANALILRLLREHPDFSVAYSLSGVFLDQCAEYGQDVLDSFRALAETGRVEFLAETYYHSLCSLVSVEEFCMQVGMHVRRIEALFGQTPSIMRNTELIYNNQIAHIARLMGFSGILSEGADKVLRGESPNHLYRPPHFRLPRAMERTIAAHRPLPERSPVISVLLKNYRLSDDVAFRFSDRTWPGFPLYAETFAGWLSQCEGHTINLFMDYETFGEHQWEDTGIFSFLESLPAHLYARDMRTSTPSEVIRDWKKDANEHPVFDAHAAISWADTERDLSAWLGNHIQGSALASLYLLERAVKESKDEKLLDDWRKLQTSDHLYYMCTKYWSDGDVHKYFSPYDSPYEAFRRFSHALCDLKARLNVAAQDSILTH